MMDFGTLFASELVGTMLMVVLGNSVAFNLLGKKTFGRGSGWLVGSLAWGVSVMVSTFVSQAIATQSAPGAGGVLNPAVAVALMLDKTSFVTPAIGFVYIAGEFAGAFVGQVLVDLINWRVLVEIRERSFGAHSCVPAYDKSRPSCFANVALATCVLVFFVVYVFENLGGLQPGIVPLLVGIVIFAIALANGGLTGYTNNPARDFCPRLVYMIVHKALRFEGRALKAGRWDYGWIPFCAPLLAGTAMGAFLAI